MDTLARPQRILGVCGPHFKNHCSTVTSYLRMMMAQLVKWLLVFRGTRRFITMFVWGCQLTASDRAVVQFSHIRPVSLNTYLNNTLPSLHIFVPKFCISRSLVLLPLYEWDRSLPRRVVTHLLPRNCSSRPWDVASQVWGCRKETHSVACCFLFRSFRRRQNG